MYSIHITENMYHSTSVKEAIKTGWYPDPTPTLHHKDHIPVQVDLPAATQVQLLALPPPELPGRGLNTIPLSLFTSHFNKILEPLLNLCCCLTASDTVANLFLLPVSWPT